MRLFKSNKSQASLEDRSPEQPEPAYQAQHPNRALYSEAQFDLTPDRYSQQPVDDNNNNEYQIQDSPSQSQFQPHPAQHLSRSQSSRVSSSGAVYGAHRPSVNVVPPLSPPAAVPEDPGPVPGQTTFGQSRHVRGEREKDHKRSKRSFITGLIKDKTRDEDKEREKEKENAQGERRIGRSSSVHLLRKVHPSEPISRESYSQQTSPLYQPRHSVFYPATDISVATTQSDQAEHDHYQGGQGHFDSPQSQTTHQSVGHAEDTPHLNPRQEQYQAYHQSDSASTSEQYLPYQEPPSRPTNADSDPYQHLRPSSQASFGPPSPVANLPHTTHPHESRPSTAATNRYSVQSASQGQSHQQQQGVMARGDPAIGPLRQQLSQRDTRSEELSQYPSQQDPRLRMSQQVSEQGRNTPPPRSREDPSQLEYHQLLQRHEELQAKYSKVKRYYFEREAQVTQLQNTVANQRLSMSKTSLDDAQYTARFERLSQAINNLSFNIRKNWRAVPPWLRHVCNQDAHTIGTKEMTAVGRACITRWLYESIFERTFHPGIDPGLSAHLKNVERNLRRSGQNTFLTDEQRDDLITKLTTWRLTTIEGLQDVLNSPQAEQYKENLTKMFTHQLTESLKANLSDPPPLGLTEGVNMIVGQAIDIAANIPLESRDICLEYFMPGTPVNDAYMKIEAQLTPVTNPGLDERLAAMQAAQAAGPALQEGPDGNGMSTANTEDGPRDVEAEIREAAGKTASQKAAQGSNLGPSGHPPRTDSIASQSSQVTIKTPEEKQSKKPSFLGGFGKKTPSTRNDTRGGTGEAAGAAAAGHNGDEQRGNAREGIVADSTQLVVPGANEGRIRFAAFLAVEVRGKGPGSNAGNSGTSQKETGSAAGGLSQPFTNVLFKAPVYEY
ncbi:hypothetical protein A1O1_07140 [Capronia coronata CBS 617.96]|uniref:Uncharacterized protein n=1 Tax=Capronia coronata CBS 617.96 TaxID=1182541 RepID=W9XSJ3_9EURO|nr:uncharacterized protein A1O1_07140 [Capronia coronata CBS 617.96]EXJ83517.1 hypothetical protein A1O1_07140 [Capronia coronata CBS 617.96]